MPRTFLAFDLALRRLIEPLARFWEVERVFPDTGNDDCHLQAVIEGSAQFHSDNMAEKGQHDHAS